MNMNSPSAETTAAHERCQYRTPAGRRCALHILDPRSSFCPRHASAQIPDSQDFSALILKHAGDFDDPAEIKHALASLFKLLASGRITSRRAKALAYIASLLLRTLRDSTTMAANQGVEILVTPRDRDLPPENSPSPTTTGFTSSSPAVERSSLEWPRPTIHCDTTNANSRPIRRLQRRANSSLPLRTHPPQPTATDAQACPASPSRLRLCRARLFSTLETPL